MTVLGSLASLDHLPVQHPDAGQESLCWDKANKSGLYQQLPGCSCDCRDKQLPSLSWSLPDGSSGDWVKTHLWTVLWFHPTQVPRSPPPRVTQHKTCGTQQDPHPAWMPQQDTHHYEVKHPWLFDPFNHESKMPGGKTYNCQDSNSRQVNPHCCHLIALSMRSFVVLRYLNEKGFARLAGTALPVAAWSKHRRNHQETQSCIQWLNPVGMSALYG